MKVLGITGGIGSGKSVVSKILETKEIPVYNSDLEAKRLMESSPTIRKKLSERFGKDLYEKDTLNKNLLASVVFDHPKELAFVNSVVHPEVYQDFMVWKEKSVINEWVGIESAILFESGFDQYADFCLLVSAPLEIRIQRTQERDHVSKEAILNRIRNQMPEEEKQSLADFTIVNDDCQAILPQIDNLINCMSIL